MGLQGVILVEALANAYKTQFGRIVDQWRRSEQGARGTTDTCQGIDPLLEPPTAGRRARAPSRRRPFLHPCRLAQRYGRDDYGSEGWGFDSLPAR